MQKFFTANIDDLSFSSDKQLQLATHLQAKEFVPLSDVPDVVWKTNINRVKPEVTRAMENWNHYADIDLPGGDGQTLMAGYLADEDSLNHGYWVNFYEGAPVPSASTLKSNNQGALPFRVWQIFAQLVEFAKRGDGASFLTAAGCLAHYVGDACQPLHSSQHSDGLNGASTGVHSTYEDNMVNAHADDIAAGIADAIKNLNFTPRAIHGPRDAAKVVMDLMIFAQQTLPPETICQTYDDARPGRGQERHQGCRGRGRTLGEVRGPDHRSHCSGSRDAWRNLDGRMDAIRGVRQFGMAHEDLRRHERLDADL